MVGFGRGARIGAALAASAVVIAGCRSFPEDSLIASGVIAEDGGAEPIELDAGMAPSMECRPAVASDKLPARTAVMRRASARVSVNVSTRELFQKFSANCKGCHVDQSQGSFQVLNREALVETDDGGVSVADKLLERLTTDDLTMVMPPGSPAFSSRPDRGDPIRDLAELIQAWIKAGRPKEGFETAVPGITDSPYLLDHDVAKNLTNLGNCIPGRARFGSETSRSAALDAMFEKAIELPERLTDTDLFTLDSRELARFGVVAFAPAYTLWADNAKKLRMVRVPRGQQIQFDKQGQRFVIPSNTRFYKTFLKKVVDKDGKERYRKMETRLIVSRPDDATDKSKASTERHQALFGTYAWNEQETEARLVRDPLRNGKPFADRLVPFFTDEQKVEELIAAGEPNLQAKVRELGLSRTYAIPGSERCIHCHMGAPNESFVLGFTPLQIHRRPEGEGGVIEPAEQDELDQVKRLIDLGVIGGMSGPGEITLLEESQGEREPRNEHELDAQGYMLGNCAHCHNPRGFPSEVSAELKEDLNFMPDPDEGGIFQFPLEKYSRRALRGVNQDFRIPYITPSLFDRPSAYSAASSAAALPTKLQNCPVSPIAAAFHAEPVPNLAPWRSLIYRNVDSPFSYADDFAIFPHMPRDTPGFDCRAKRLLGSWMVSIPSRLKDVADLPPPQLSRSGYFDYFFEEALYDVEQPYVEVLPDDPNYGLYELSTGLKLAEFQSQGRYQDCPDPALDIVDPVVEEGLTRKFPQAEASFTREDQCEVAGGLIPERSHWFDLDLTEPPGDWLPRRGDWKAILVEGRIDPQPLLESDKLRNRSDRRTVYLLTGRDPWAAQPDQSRGPDVRISAALREFALSPTPMGLWQQKQECEERFAGAPADVVPRASDFAGRSRPRWMDHKVTRAILAQDPDAPVYAIAPGAQVFTSICINCHGPLADSKGRMADNLADMTGGDTRVANLRDGFFGPVDRPGENRHRVFELGHSDDGVTSEDWAARYLVWMGSGGTQRVIPSAILNAVATTRVMGVKREGLTELAKYGANMLGVADFLCGNVLPYMTSPLLRFDVARGLIDSYEMYPEDPERPTGTKPPLALVSDNGDAEFWQSLCSFDNPAPVLSISLEGTHFVLTRQKDQKLYKNDGTPEEFLAERQKYYRRSEYEASGGPVGDAHGHVHSRLEATNLAPWCIERPATAEQRDQLAAKFRQSRPGDDSAPPYCPEGLGANTWINNLDHAMWTRRGSMNAGLTVFLYLDGLAKQVAQRPVEFNRCEQLPEVWP
jgi:mono/diheme cytochrome c family protein